MNRTLPIAFLVHGGPQGSFNDSWSFRWNPRLFTAPGYAAVSVDFHGSTGYGQAFTDAIHQNWGGWPLEDLQKGLAYATAHDPQLDAANACALGGSYGGYMMNWIEGNWPDRFKCIVQHDGVFDARAMAYETEELWFDEWEHGKHPYYEAPQEFEKWNPVNFVARWKTPQLVITSENDFRIPYTQGIAAFTALQRRNIPSRLLVFPDENHWVLKPKNSIQWYDQVFGWMNIGGWAAATDWPQPHRARLIAAALAWLTAPRMTELPKTFEPRAIEERWYAHWESAGLFRPDRGDATPWTIVMPPPNVTGILHIGHALDITLQDVLTRRERMRGKDALWVVGTDHAGIATQMVVERNLEVHQDKRTNYTREQFVDKVWEWKAESGGQITQPAPPARRIVRLGARALHHGRGLLAAPSPRCSSSSTSAASPTATSAWSTGTPSSRPRSATSRSRRARCRASSGRCRYPLADGSGAIEVATTRPETMLADMAVAVHPDDERYKALIGKQVKHPITGRLIPIIADEHADPELGSRRGQDHAGARFQRFRGRQARRHQARRHAQHVRCAGARGPDARRH